MKNEEKNTERKHKSTHRGHNEGSCYQRKDGKWMGQVQVGFNEKGKRKFITKTASTKQEIYNWLTEVKNDILKGNFIAPNDITVEQWIWNWMVTYKLKTVSSRTYVRYLSLIKNHILPGLGNLKLKDLRTYHIQKIYNDAQDNGASYSAIKHIHTVFNQSLDCAVKEGLISKNYAIYTTRKKPKTKPKAPVFSPEAQKEIVDNIPFTPLGVLIKTGIGTGCRMGELLGLQWNNIDFENNVIHITNGMVKETKFSEDGKSVIGHELIIDELKTPTSLRDIPIAESTASMLKSYRHHQRSFIDGNPDVIPTVVFLSSAGTLWDESNVRKAYKKYLESINVPYIKFHALRHTFATRIMEAGVHGKIAQELLGHSSITITMDTYSHVLDEQKKKAIDKIKDIV